VNGAASRRPGLSAWVGLAKLRLNALVLFAAYGGYRLGAGGHGDGARLVATLLGAFLSAVGGSALNMLLEREHDARMERTRERPLPTGELTPRQAAAFGVACSALGIGLLWAVGWAPALTSAVIVFSYLFVYTPLKRRTSLNTVVGAVTGALPPVLGWSAATGGFETPAWTLFGIVFCWQIPHFLAIARLHEADYARGGYRMLPAEDPEGRAVGRQVALWWAALFAVSLTPATVGLAGTLYVVAATALGAAFGAASIAFAVRRDLRTARVLFLASVVYLALLWIALLVDAR